MTFVTTAPGADLHSPPGRELLFRLVLFREIFVELREVPHGLSGLVGVRGIVARLTRKPRFCFVILHREAFVLFGAALVFDRMGDAVRREFLVLLGILM